MHECAIINVDGVFRGGRWGEGTGGRVDPPWGHIGDLLRGDEIERVKNMGL